MGGKTKNIGKRLEKNICHKKKRRNLAETDRGSYYNQEEWLEEFLDNKGLLYNGIEAATGGIL